MTEATPTPSSETFSGLTRRILATNLQHVNVERVALEVGDDINAAWALAYRWFCRGGSSATGELSRTLAPRAPLAAAALRLSKSWWFSSSDPSPVAAVRHRAEITALLGRIADAHAPALVTILLCGFLDAAEQAGAHERDFDNSWIPAAVERALLAAA
jgi:hypothetical protein